MDVFKKFFQVWSYFDWDNSIVTIYGPIKATNFYENLKNCQFDVDRLVMLERMQNYDLRSRNLLVAPKDLEKLMIRFSGVRLTDVNAMNQATKKSVNLKFINLIDPTFSKNNLGKSISKINSSRIKHGLRL